MILLPFLLVIVVDAFNDTAVFAPDRSVNDEPLIRRLWNLNKRSKPGHLTTAPLVVPGDSADRPINLLFWKKNMDIFGQNYDIEPGYTDCGSDLHCHITNERSDLTRAHVVLFLEQRDKNTLSQMRAWQAAAVFVPTTIMSYIDGPRELSDVDVVLGYSPRWADLVVDYSAGWLRFFKSGYLNGAEEAVEAAWWDGGRCGVSPPDQTNRDYDLAMFNNDCVSLDSIYGGRYARSLFDRLLDGNITINSYGSCLTSHTLPRSINLKDPEQVFEEMKRHRLVFIHETTRTRDYVTEQIYWALAAGAIPIYIGAPNIDDYMPCSSQKTEAESPCFVDASGLRPEEVAELVREIVRGGEYGRYHRWRLMQWGKMVEARGSVLRRGPEGFPCRLCKWYRDSVERLRV